MNTHADKTQENKSQSVANETSQKLNGSELTFQFVDNRPQAIAQRMLQNMVDNSPRAKRAANFLAIANNNIANGMILQMFKHGKYNFKDPEKHKFSNKAIYNVIKPIPYGESRRKTGRRAKTGVRSGRVGSYHFVRHLEKHGDHLTGDHQPSGAAIKEALRQMLHNSLNMPLTRSMARNAYEKAITIVMNEFWHKTESRTYGGKNTKAQILNDAQDLVTASIEDWKKTIPELEKEGFTKDQIEGIWKDLCSAREFFFKTGNAQVGTL